MRLALVLLLVWPFGHVEHGVVHIPDHGIVTIGFQKPFKDIPACSVDKKFIRFRTVSREWAEIVGPVGERVA
jgi:hypothetical protein